MTRQMKILMGFNLKSKQMDRDTEDKIRKYLLAHGIEATFNYKTSKKDIQTYLADNKDCNHAILMNSASETKNAEWTEKELADLVDERNIVLIPILQHNVQLPFLVTLYAAGITSALIEKSAGGVSEEEVAELLINPRSKKAARDYYHISTQNISIRNITTDMYDALCIRLSDPEYGVSKMDRMLKVAGSLNPYQMEDFLKKLPPMLIAELEQYEEYYNLIQQLRESGIRMKYKRPKVFRTINDDCDMNTHAKLAIEKKNLDASAFEKPIEEKKNIFGGLFGKKKEEPKEEIKPVTKEEVKAVEVEEQPKTAKEIIDNMDSFYDNGIEDAPMLMEEEDFEDEIMNAEIDIAKLSEPKVTATEPETETAQDVEIESDDDEEDDEQFLIY